MKKLFTFSVLILLLIMISCTSEKQKHQIIGQWESKQIPKLILYFNEDNSLKSEYSVSDYSYKDTRKYSIINENKVEIIDNSVGQKVMILITIDDLKMSLKCNYKRLPNEPNIVDLPILCAYQEFMKVK